MPTLRFIPAVLALLALPGPVRAQDRRPPAVVFFWSSPGQADAGARAALLPAVEAGARKAGAVSADLSSAAPPAPAVADQVSRAIAAYDGMRFSDAVFELDQAAALAAEHGGRGLGRDALVDLFLYRALARSETGDSAAAWNDFVRAATIDPTRVLDPARFRPSAVKSFTRAVDEVKARAAVELTVNAPPGSKVHVDGRATGRADAIESLPPGEHYLWVDRPTSTPLARVVTLSAATRVAIAEDPVTPPNDGELGRRAARLGSGPVLVVALRRDGGVGLVELRSIGPRGATLRGVIRLGPSPEASAADLEAAVTRALRAMAQVAAPVKRAPAGGDVRAEPWYRNRWVWLAVGVVATAAALSPFVLDGSSESSPTDAALDPSALER